MNAGPGVVVAAVVGLLGVVTVFDSYYTISQGQVGYARVMGSADKTQPLHPGAHMKFPFLTTIDKVDITRKTAHIEPFVVKTADNQMITLKINITYDTPESAAYYLLYSVGRPGEADITENVAPIVRDRAGQIFSSQNTTVISTDRVAVQSELTKLVHDELNRLYGVNVASLQIDGIGYSKAFEESNDRAVLAKNEAILQENRKRVFEYEAAQKVIAAKGAADQAIEDARGKSQSARLEADGVAYRDLTVATAKAKALTITAEAEKQAATLRGAGDASALKALVDATGGPDKYVAKIQAEAMKQWQGNVPTYVVSDKAMSFMPLPGFNLTK